MPEKIVKGKVEEPNKKPEETQSPFNFALATLERIHEVLRDIKNNEVKEGLNKIQKQVYKLRLIRQLFVQAYPLLDKSDKKTIKEKVYATKMRKKLDIHNHKQLYFSHKLDDEINNCILMIEDSLQKSGRYFMPSQADPRYSWRQT
jgi:hypothetical protein